MEDQNGEITWPPTDGVLAEEPSEVKWPPTDGVLAEEDITAEREDELIAQGKEASDRYELTLLEENEEALKTTLEPSAVEYQSDATQVNLPNQYQNPELEIDPDMATNIETMMTLRKERYPTLINYENQVLEGKVEYTPEGASEAYTTQFKDINDNDTYSEIEKLTKITNAPSINSEIISDSKPTHDYSDMSQGGGPKLIDKEQTFTIEEAATERIENKMKEISPYDLSGDIGTDLSADEMEALDTEGKYTSTVRQLDKDFANAKQEYINEDPYIISKVAAYRDAIAPQLEAKKEELQSKYTLDTPQNVDMANKEYEAFRAGILNKLINNDPSIKGEVEKISKAVGGVYEAKFNELGRAQSDFFSEMDYAYEGADNYVWGVSHLLKGINLVVEGAVTSGTSLAIEGVNDLDNWYMSRFDVEPLVSERDQLQLALDEAHEKYGDEWHHDVSEKRIKFLNKKIAEYGEDFKTNYWEKKAVTDWAEFGKKADWEGYPGIDDVLLGLGESLPQMTLGIAGGAAAVAGAPAWIPIALAAAGTAQMTATEFGSSFAQSIEDGLRNDGKEVTEQNITDALIDGKYNHDGMNFAAAASQALLENFGGFKAGKAFFGVTSKAGVKAGLASMWKKEWGKILPRLLESGKVIGKNSITEAFTEAGQDVISQVNQIVQNKGYEGLLNDGINVNQVLTSAKAGGYIGAFIPFSGSIRNQLNVEARNVARDFVTKFDIKSAKGLYEQGKVFKQLEIDIKKKYKNPNGSFRYNENTGKQYTPEDLQKELITLSDIRNEGSRIPKKWSVEGKQEALDIMVQNRNLEKEKADLNPELAKDIDKQIKQNNKKLGQINFIETEFIKAGDVNTKAGKISEALNTKFIELEDDAAIEEYITKRGLKGGKEAKGNIGNFITVDPKTEETVILINKKRLKDSGNYYTGAHEVLHRVLANTIAKGDANAYAMAQAIKDKLKTIDTSKAANVKGRENFFRRLNQYVTDPLIDTAEAAEEAMTLMSEAIEYGDIKFDRSFLEVMSDFIKKMAAMVMPDTYGKYKFENVNDVYKFLRDYNKSFNKGKLSKAMIRAANEGIDISDELIKRGEKAEAKRQKKIEVHKKKRQSKTRFKGAKDDVINRLNEEGATPAEIANEFYGDVDRFIRSGKFKIGGTPLIDNPKIKAYDEDGYRKEGAVEIEDIVFGILYAPRGVVGLIEDYRKKPQEYRDKVTLGQFVNDTKVGFRTRAIAIAAEILGMKTQGEYKGDDYADSTTETKKSLRQTMLELESELDLEEGSELYNDVIESTIKILGTSLPKISSDKFLAELRKSSNSFLETKMKKLMGTPKSTQYKDFIEKFGLAILNKVDQRTLNKRFQPLTEPDIDPETGIQRRILTKESRQEGSRVKNPYAGNPARKIKPNLTPKDLVDFFINSKRPDARRNTLAQVVANEFTEDSIPMVLQEVVEINPITQQEVTVGDLREERFGEDVAKAEVAYVARELGRGVDYKFAKDGIPRTIAASKEQIFSGQANKLIDIAFRHGYKDDNGNLTDKYRSELAKVDPLVAEYMEVIFEENIDLINADSGFQKILKNSDRVSQSMKDNIKGKKLLLFKKKELQKDNADAFNDGSKYMGGIIDSRIFKNLGGIDLLGYKNRYLDPAFRKVDLINSTPGNRVYLKNPDGSFVTGEYYTDYAEISNLSYSTRSYLLGFNPNDIIAINKDSQKLAPILKDILSTENLDQKLEKLEKHKARLEKANKANIGAFKHISLKLQQALKDGKITEEYIYQLLQAQTNIVMGLRALSSIDYLYLKEGNQQLPTKKTFNIEEVGTDKFNQYYNELMNVVDFKERHDIATKFYKQEGLSGAELELAALNKAYSDLTIKGEHLGPNANTMASLYEHIVNGTLTNEVLNDLLKEHSQFFAPNFITDLIDKKGIETGPKSGMTSKEGLFRLTKFLPPRFAKHAYSITGETAAKKIAREEVILKDIYKKNASKDSAKREDIKMLEDSKVLNLNENMSMEQVLEKAVAIDKALEVARKINAPVKKIRVFDFDDTVARTKSKVIATRIEPSKRWDTREVTTEMYGSDRSGRAYKKGRDSEGKINKSRAEDIIYTARQRDQISLTLENNTPLVREALETLGMTSKSDIRKARHVKDDGLEGKLKRSLRKEPKFEEKMLTAEEFAEQGEQLTNEGWKMDFSEFNKVVDGKAGPLLNVAKKIQEARGTEDIFILTARAQQAAPAIKKFLDAMGLSIPLKNITGLANSSPQAKANWILDKAAEGYNDFYFADDHTPNVDAVKKVLDVVDVKGKVQQAKIKASKDFDREFNRIIEQKTGVASHKVYSEAKGKVRGSSKGKFKFWIPYSAEDFVGLIYPLLSKNELGDKQMAWFKRNLLDPYNRAMQNLSNARLQLMNDFKALKKDLKIPKTLEKEAIEGFSNEQAVRVYLWNKQGVNIPGLSKSDIKALTNVVENDLLLKEFADQLEQINKDPYPSPQDSWLAGTITTDLIDGLNTTKREKYLKEWQDNVDTIFSDKNFNKLEAVHGSKYVEALRNILSRMKSGKNRLQSGNRLSNRVLNYINGSNAAIMFLNTRSAILQTISAINFINWNFNSPIKAGKAFANQPQYWKDFMYLMNSEYLKDRRNGLRINITESEIADLAKTSKNKAKAAIAYILKKGYLPTQFADSFAIATGGATFYRNRINDLIKNQGLSEKEASKIAMEEFIDISEVSQQSSNPSKISSQQSSDMGRLILMFANTPMQYARIQKRAFQDLANGRGSAKANMSKIVYYGFIQNIIFNGLQQALWMMGFGDDEEEDEKKVSKTVNGMLDSQLRGLGIGGSALSVAKNFLLDIYERSKKSRPEYSDAAWKLLQISPPISSKISRLRAAAWPFESKKRRKEIEDKGFSIDNPAYESLAKVVSATTNIPLDRLLSKYNNVNAAMEEDAAWWQSVAMIAGWPSWVIKPDAEEVIKKKERKEKKKISAAKKVEKEKQDALNEKEKKKREDGEGKSRHAYKNGRLPAGVRTDREDNLYDLNKKQQEDSLKKLVPDYYTKKRLRDLNEGDRVAAIINING